MANVIYPKALEHLWSGDIDVLTDDIRFALIDTGTYTYNAAHEDMADVTGIVAQMASGLTGKSVTGGVFNASDPTIADVSGNTVEAVICFKKTGTTATDLLIAYIDTESDGSTPISFTPNGSGVLVNIPAGGIASLAG
jgi:hypothetical protein